MCGFVAVATEWLITHHCLLSILDGLDFMFGEKHWKRGAVKCLPGKYFDGSNVRLSKTGRSLV